MSRTTEANSTKRDRLGQYAHSLEAMCVCGKSKGEHSAARPHDCDETGCEKFRKVK